MKERPILFSTEMVRAILDGRKTMTRRVIKPQPNKDDYCEISKGYFIPIEKMIRHCLYGQVGDRLWVRETHKLFCKLDVDRGWVEYSTGEQEIVRFPDGKYKPSLKWKSSLFMPKWASRITLEITQVRVERLQDITEEDAEKEGCDSFAFVEYRTEYSRTARMSFELLWDSLNSKRGYSWESNPWVWVIEFRRIQ